MSDSHTQFRFSTTAEVRWRDLDGLGHANNAVYFTYLEQARVHYLQALGLYTTQAPSQVNIILAEATCQFKSPLRLGEKVTIAICTSELRNSSFDFVYQITGEDGRLVATAQTVQVCYDYQHERPMRIPEPWRQAIVAYEPGLQSEP